MRERDDAVVDSLGRLYGYLCLLYSIEFTAATLDMAKCLGASDEECEAALDLRDARDLEATVDWSHPLIRRANDLMADRIVDLVRRIESLWQAIQRCSESIALCLGYELAECRRMLSSFEGVPEELTGWIRAYRPGVTDPN